APIPPTPAAHPLSGRLRGRLLRPRHFLPRLLFPRHLAARHLNRHAFIEGESRHAAAVSCRSHSSGRFPPAPATLHGPAELPVRTQKRLHLPPGVRTRRGHLHR